MSERHAPSGDSAAALSSLPLPALRRGAARDAPRHARSCGLCGARAALFITVASLTGCTFGFGRGATGELVVPRERLRTIQPATMEQIQTAAPKPARALATTLPTTLPAPLAEQREVMLSIEESRRLALENNLELRVELFEPALARQTLTEERSRFEALFTTTASYDKNDSPTATRLESNQSNNLRVTPGVELPLVTGGTLRADLPLSRFESDNEFSLLNPAYASDFVVSFSQPLLRGAGVYANTQGIRLAFYNYQSSQARTKLEIIRVLTIADRVYWRLYAARQEAKLRRQEYDLAVAQLDRARRQANAGVVAEVDIVRAESGVADTLEAVIIADNALRDRQRELKRILNSPDLRMDEPVAVVPSTEPRPLRYSVDATGLAAAAVTNRMEMLETELAIARDVSEVYVARNATLPLVSLDYAYGVNGLGPSFDDSFEMLRESDFADHRFGLRVQVPVGNQAAMSRLRRALLRRLQTLATRDQRDLQVRQEVFNAVDQLEATWQRILATRQRVVLAARVVELEQRQFNLGLRTSTDVLDAQTRLANAQSAEVQAIAEYQIAQVDIAQATGTVLGASKVDWAPAQLPQK
jgi:outer membrane protein